MYSYMYVLMLALMQYKYDVDHDSMCTYMYMTIGVPVSHPYVLVYFRMASSYRCRTCSCTSSHWWSANWETF